MIFFLKERILFWPFFLGPIGDDICSNIFSRVLKQIEVSERRSSICCSLDVCCVDPPVGVQLLEAF